MAISVTDDIALAPYKFRLTHKDRNNEETRKVFNLSNYDTPSEEGVNEFLPAYATLTYAGLSGSASIDAGLETSGDELTPDATENLFNSAAILLVLGFERQHPLNANLTISTTFTIPAPKAEIISSELKPEYVHAVAGDEFADAATLPETLGALILWLQGSLSYQAINGTTYFGGWTYSPGRSGVVQQGRILDGIPNT